MAEVDSDPVISVFPTETNAAPGHEVRFQFMTVGDETVAYWVQCADAGMSSWCRVLLPAVRAGPGELVVDVPADARPGRYPLRLVATAGGREIAAADVRLRIEGERCLRIVSVPKFSLQADGTVLVTLRVVNCGMVDANLLLRARHEDGWSFSMDSPELIIGVGKGPVTVKVTLRPPIGRKADRGDCVTVEVETGTGWQPLQGRVQRPPWPWVAAAVVALVVVAAAAGAAWAWWPESDDNGTVTTGPDNGPVDDGPDAGLPGDIDVETSQVDFGQITVGQAADQTVVFRNIGDQSVDVSVEVDGDDEIAAESGCDVVGAGEECELLISFTPGEEGFYQASVTVGDEAIEVTGEGVADEPDPVEIESLTVTVSSCDVTARWNATGDPEGRLELSLNGTPVDETFPVGPGSHQEGGVGVQATAELVAFDSEGNETDRESDSDEGACVE